MLHNPQGVALGWHISALRAAEEKKLRIENSEWRISYLRFQKSENGDRGKLVLSFKF